MLRSSPLLDTIVTQAIEISNDAEREQFLAGQCGDNSELRDCAQALISAHFRAGRFLEVPLVIERTSVEVGMSIGPYRLLEMLGEGGMGVVYVAEQVDPVKRCVALKIIKPGMDTREVIARFEAERQALAMMDHPKIAKVLDGGETLAGRPYFVMELVRGLPITEYCDQSRVSSEGRLRLFVQVCRAVQHAHQKGIIHRDLKPSNILITLHDGQPAPKVIDFGVAKAIGQRLTEHSAHTRFTQLIGTPLYMSPEQADLTALDIDTRSDVYSLGVLLYELLTSTTPFEPQVLREAGFDEMRRMIREDDPPRPSQRLSTLETPARSTVTTRRGVDERQLARQLRGDLDWIVMKALEKDRNRRYESAGSLAADIERYLANEPVDARPPSNLYRARKLALKYRTVVGSSLLVSIAVLLGLAFSLLKYSDERAARQDATHNAEEAMRQTKAAQRAREDAERQRNEVARNLYCADTRLGLADWSVGNIGRLTRTLANQVPKPNEPDLRGWEWYYLVSLCHRDDRTLTFPNAEPRSIAFSPDGRLLATADTSGQTSIWDAHTWQVVNSCASMRNALAWSPDGEQLAGVRVGNDKCIIVWRVKTNEVKTIGDHFSTVRSIVWLANGNQLLSCGGDSEITIWNVSTAAVVNTQTVNPERCSSIAISPDRTRLATVAPSFQIQIRDASTGQMLRVIKPPGWPWPKSVAWSPDGNRIAAGDGFGGCTIYGTGDGMRIGSWHAHNGDVNFLAWSPDGQLLATAGDDQLVRIWSPIDGKELGTLRGHLNHVTSLDWEPTSRRLASASSDRSVKIWTIPPSQEPIRLANGSKSPVALAYKGFDELLVLDILDGSITTWNIQKNTRLDGMSRSAKGELGILASQGRAWAVARPSVSQGEDHRSEWRYEIGFANSNSTVVINSPFAPDGACFSADGSLLAIGGRGGMTLVEPLQNRVVLNFQCLEIRGFAWSPDNRLLAASGRGDAGVYLLDLAQRKLIQTLPPAPNGSNVYSVAWSPDGKRLAAGDGDGNVEVFDVRSGNRLAGARLHTAHVYSLVWSEDGRRVVSGSEDRTVRVWDPENCNEFLRLDTPSCENHQLLWSPDGRKIIAAGNNGEVSIWDATAGFRYATSDAIRYER